MSGYDTPEERAEFWSRVQSGEPVKAEGPSLAETMELLEAARVASITSGPHVWVVTYGHWSDHVLISVHATEAGAAAGVEADIQASRTEPDDDDPEGYEREREHYGIDVKRLAP